MKTTAIVLAAGSGKRMNSNVKKQYLEIDEKPVLFYSLRTFEDSFVDSVILVTSEKEKEYCKKEIIDKYNFKKVHKIVNGGAERYHSVMNAMMEAGTCDYIFIHDGARPFITQDILKDLYETVCATKACVTAMPVKDTIKIADKDGFIESTPNRSLVWNIQTPQVFDYNLIKQAYTSLKEKEKEIIEKGIQITDDAMVVEYFTGQKIKLVKGSYYNIKITTPEDLEIAQKFVKKIYAHS